MFRISFFTFSLSILTPAFCASVAAQLSTPRGFLEYCLGEPDRCAFSINHLDLGWERHWNADRLQPTGSTFKILTLIAYAEAVVDGRLDPNRFIHRDQWARYSVRRDGGALENAWNRLGRPEFITLDQMARAMIRESDNAAPDWFLNELGHEALKEVVERYIVGYHDAPESINALFITVDGNPADPAIGARILASYSSFFDPRYKAEVRTWFGDMQNSGFVDEIRAFSCLTVPWRAPPPGCVSGFQVSLSDARELLRGYFMHSNTRTYNNLMLSILDESLLSSDVQQIVRRHLEFRISEFSNFAAAFTRHGAKGGSLAPQDILNWSVYMQSRITGRRLVASVFLRDVPANLTPLLCPPCFAEEVLFNVNFANEVRDSVPIETRKADLIGRVDEFELQSRRSGSLISMLIAVRNIGTAPASGPWEASLMLSADPIPSPEDTLLHRIEIAEPEAQGEEDNLIFSVRVAVPEKAISSATGYYVILDVDSGKKVQESDEQNNVVWIRVPPLKAAGSLTLRPGKRR